MNMIRLIPGAQPELIESCCRGMAGSFGYEASHCAVSIQTAELSLLPAVRKQPNAFMMTVGTKSGTVRSAKRCKSQCCWPANFGE